MKIKYGRDRAGMRAKMDDHNGVGAGVLQMLAKLRNRHSEADCVWGKLKAARHEQANVRVLSRGREV